jgi:hypothetical protein
LWALCLGFSALLISNNPTVAEFAGLLIVAIAANFLASMTALPAVLLVMKPRFLTKSKEDYAKNWDLSGAGIPTGTFALLVAAGLSLAGIFFANDSRAQDQLTPKQIVENVNNRDEGKHLTRDIFMQLTDRKGRVRERKAIGYRLDTDSERRSMIVFTEPSNIKDTAFLTYDYEDAERDDQQWLYLPKLRRSRRVSGAERGEYFLGTDFTFEDLKLEGRISDIDYAFRLIDDPEAEPGSATLEGIPHSQKIARELGYGKVHIDVDTDNWTVLTYRIWGVKGRPLKKIRFLDIQQIEGIWTIGVIAVENYKTKHQTRFEFTSKSYTKPVSESLMDQRNLNRAGR